MHTLGEALREATGRLAASGLPDARLDAEVLLHAATGADRATLIAWPERRISSAQWQQLRALIERRAAGEPVAHILGRREFWSLSLRVTEHTLIPRPDTELLVDWALATLPAQAPLTCADLGTGSGAIAAALATERPRWTLIGIERCAAAAAVAADNARRLGLDGLLLARADWLQALADDSLDAIVANPPYIRAGDPHLITGDLRFEPRSALVAGADGLEAVRAILGDAPRCLRPDGWLATEHGWDQGAAVRRLLRDRGFDAVTTHRDLAGHERITSGRIGGRAASGRR
jgi:release factor glutamine methyltransferase